MTEPLTKEEVQWIEEQIINSPEVKAWVESIGRAFIAYKTLRGSVTKVKTDA